MMKSVVLLSIVKSMVLMLLCFLSPVNTYSDTAKSTISGDTGFGISVDMDDSYMVVGADQSNKALVYAYSSAYNTWGTTADTTFNAPDNVNSFGQSVGIDGNNVIVGASASGSAFIFEYSSSA